MPNNMLCRIEANRDKFKLARPESRYIKLVK